MKLQSLLSELPDIEQKVDPSIEVKGLTSHTQEVEPGFAFIALKGTQHDGKQFIHEAIQKGAQAVFCEAKECLDLTPNLTSGFTSKTKQTIPVIAVNDLHEKIGTLARTFYGDPTQALELIGITGTNGKTTSCFLLAQALTRLGITTGIIGTVGYGLVQQLMPCPLTTPDPLLLQRYFKNLKDKGVATVAMEVSSHGLAQNRVKSLPFKSALFTNLTKDHLDYHLDMQTYGKAKQKLFQFDSLERAIINADSSYGPEILKATKRGIEILLYSLQPRPDFHHFNHVHHRGQVALMTIEDYALDQKGISATIKTPFGKGCLRSPLVGEFNLSNLLGVLGELCLRGVPFKEALSALLFALPPPGRMQRLGSVNTPQIIVDHGHTPDALEKALQAVRVHSKGRVWCVFGCGGDRDKSKRTEMGNIAAEHADKIILTSDNPRSENPHQIIEDILCGVAIEFSHKITIKENRFQAIQHAIHHALPVDTILIAGKGHENYQIVGDQKLPFNDAECVNMVLGEKSDHEAFNNSKRN